MRTLEFSDIEVLEHATPVPRFVLRSRNASTSARARANTTLPILTGTKRLFVGVKVEQLVDGMDRFYSDFRNRGISTCYALYIVDMQLSGELAALGRKLKKVRNALKASPHIYALFRSPLGDGLWAVFRILPDEAQQRDSFRAIEQHVLGLTGIRISKSAMLVDTLASRGARILVKGWLIQFP